VSVPSTSKLLCSAAPQIPTLVLYHFYFIFSGYLDAKSYFVFYGILLDNCSLLWETLTGREHLLFYGRLKNLGGAALKEV